MAFHLFRLDLIVYVTNDGLNLHFKEKLLKINDSILLFRLLLAFNAATCSNPPKLRGRGLHDLDSEEHLACAPLVTVPTPSVPVTKGGHALLPCRLEEGEAAEVTWLREGVAVKANLSHEAVIYGQYYVIYTVKVQFMIVYSK